MKKLIAIFFSIMFFLPFGFVFAHEEAGSLIIHMTSEGFEQSEIEVPTGSIVVFENEDTIAHWPASNIHPTHTVYPGSEISKCDTKDEAAIFDACRGIASGESYSFVFNKPGSWRYHDHLFPQQTGVINVVGEAIADGNDKESEFFSSFFKKMKLFSKRVYYVLIPGALEKKLAQIKIFDIAEDKDELEEIVYLAHPEKVMQKLLDESGGATLLDCHQEAHQVGRVSYELFGAEVFEKGDASCHSGFYHGAMEAFLSEHGTNNLAQSIEELCSIFETRFGIFECLHGVGHGVIAYLDYDLPEALLSCEELEGDFATRSCYGGVFMENVVSGQGIGAIPDHKTEWVSENPYFPCNSIGEDYGRRYECYQMQTSWMLTLSNYNFDTVVQECYGADPDMVSVCFKSLGRDIAGYTLRNPQHMLTLCEKAPQAGGYFEQCIIGGLNVIIDFWGPKLEDQAREFCEIIPQPTKETCHNVLEERVIDLFGDV